LIKDNGQQAPEKPLDERRTQHPSSAAQHHSELRQVELQDGEIF
jgi:hypothetical protein